MTGPEHYREAERLLAGPTDYIQDIGEAERDVARATAHATLALAAATALTGYSQDGMHHADFDAWDEACGVEP